MRLNVRCRGYKKRASIVYRAGEGFTEAGLPLYGLGKCPECGRVIGLAPKAQTIVMHKMMPQLNDIER